MHTGKLASGLILLGINPGQLVHTFHQFQFHSRETESASGSTIKSWGNDSGEAAALIKRLGTEFDRRRKLAKQSKDFSAVDDLKSQLLNAGVEVRMSKEGVELLPGPNFDPSKLEALT